jgi:FAD/FMN-containing dehydrogenase
MSPRALANKNKDLFWALRGGGGNFGVATAFEFWLHKLGPQVLAGLVVHPEKDPCARQRAKTAFPELQSNHAIKSFSAFTLSVRPPFQPFAHVKFSGSLVE